MRKTLLLSTLLLTPTVLAQSTPIHRLLFTAAQRRRLSRKSWLTAISLCAPIWSLQQMLERAWISLKRSEDHLAAYRTALRSSLVARQSLLGVHALSHFLLAERLWNSYSKSQLKASGDMAENLELAASAQDETRIDLIRNHMRMLDRIYYTLLHEDCGACLVDH